ncbi:MAG: ankyrin repeat domain-containing protein [Candidatus Micrarchaeaceae archaeon]
MISLDNLKEILYISDHLDLIKWRLVSKDFKNIIDSLSFNISIYTACKLGYYLVFKKYMNSYFNLNYALIKASEGGHLLMVKLLISKGAHVFISAFNIACEYGRIEIIKYLYNTYKICSSVGLYEIGVKCYEQIIDYFSTTDFNFWIPIYHGACKSGNMEIIKNIPEPISLLESIKNACESGNLKLVEYLFNKCSEPITDLTLYSYLVKSSTYGHIDIVKFLIPKCKTIYWENIIINSIESGNIELVNYLLQFSNQVDWNRALIAATMSNNIELVKLVISKEVTNFNDCMYIACSKGNKEILNLLINNGANNWNEGLFGACRTGNIEFINLMIKRGADNFDEAIIWACYSRNFNAVKLLMEKIKNKSTLNDVLETYSHFYDNLEQIKYIVDKGATDFKYTFLQSCKIGNLEVVEYFLQKGYKIDDGLIIENSIDNNLLTELFLKYNVMNDVH